MLFFVYGFVSAKVGVFPWFSERNWNKEWIKGIHLSWLGLLQAGAVFVPLILSLLSYLRAVFSDPG